MRTPCGEARELVEPADFFRQRYYRSSGMPWLDFTCESALPLVPFTLIAYRIIRCFISSWEFVTTLDYEWSVFRRRRPLRWTIWVGDNSRFLLSFHPGAAERCTNLYPLIDLLHHAHSHSIGCSTFFSRYRCYYGPI